jgi:hypothetical protein
MRHLPHIARYGHIRFADLMRFAGVGKAPDGNTLALALALELALISGPLTSKVPKS